MTGLTVVADLAHPSVVDLDDSEKARTIAKPAASRCVWGLEIDQLPCILPANQGNRPGDRFAGDLLHRQHVCPIRVSCGSLN